MLLHNLAVRGKSTESYWSSQLLTEEEWARAANYEEAASAFHQLDGELHDRWFRSKHDKYIPRTQGFHPPSRLGL